jgi:hypothetical protein
MRAAKFIGAVALAATMLGLGTTSPANAGVGVYVPQVFVANHTGRQANIVIQGSSVFSDQPLTVQDDGLGTSCVRKSGAPLYRWDRTGIFTSGWSEQEWIVSLGNAGDTFSSQYTAPAGVTGGNGNDTIRFGAGTGSRTRGADSASTFSTPTTATRTTSTAITGPT